MRLPRRLYVRALPAFAAAACLLVASSCPAQDEEDERPRIFLEKKVYSSATETGSRVYYETRTVAEGDTLWKILAGRSPLTPEQYVDQLREFRRINPSVSDPDRLVPGQKIQVPLPPASAGEKTVREGRAVSHVVAKGQSLTRILRARGVSRKEMPKYLDAVKALNPSVRNVDRILAGKTIHLPTADYFRPPEAAPPAEAPVEVAAEAAKPGSGSPILVEATPAPAPVAEVASSEAATPVPAPAGIPPVSAPPSGPEAPRSPVEAPVAPAPPAAEQPAVELTREAPAESGEPDLATGKPGAELATPPSAAPDEPPVSTVTGKPAKPVEDAPAPERPPYRGLLADVASALGEKWIDRGTLYLPMPGGGEVVINLAEFPVVRFGTGNHALIDFRGSLPSDVRSLVAETWKNYLVVPLDAVPGPAERIDRLLGASGYESVKEGTTRPLVIGESVAVTLPARWQLFRTRQAVEAGDVTLLKEVPEQLPPDLDAVLAYAGRLGIRVLPVAWDLSAREGYLAGLSRRNGADAPEPLRLPAGGLAALDASLSILGIPSETDPTIRMSGKDDAFRLVIRPERTFSANGVRYVVDTGRMSPAIRSLVQGAGYRLFPLTREETGKMVFLRLLKAAGHPHEERRRFLAAGGGAAGFDLHLTGTFVTSKPLLERRGVRYMAVVKGRQHAATRALLRELGIEIVEWVN